jgi:hypothetical protein
MRRACALGLFVALSVLGQSKLYLKTRIIDTPSAGQLRAASPAVLEAEKGGRVHLLIQFDHAPSNEDVRLLFDRGANVLGYVHENGLVITTVDRSALNDLGLQWTSEFDPSDKISPLFPNRGDDTSRSVVIEFHPDSNMAAARRIVLDAGAALADSPDLGPHHLLVDATSAQMSVLAISDEVAYIFPASNQLVSGQPVTACASALTAQGLAGQYIPKVGDGWDGAGKGAVDIAYHFSAWSTQLPADSVRSEILRALGEWAKYTKIAFSAASTGGAPKSIDVLFAKGQHGDGYPFDGPRGVLAHTFYPSPPNPEPLAGDMHFDEDEMWRIGVDKDLFSVALHEAGHALGLGHSDRPGAVMYPYYAQATGLTADDIGAIQDLYAAKDVLSTPGDPLPPTTPSQPPVTPPTSPSYPPTPVTPLLLRVAPVNSTTSAGTVTVSGSISGGSGGTSLRWSTDRGQSGSVPAQLSWSAQVPLLWGANSITFTATDSEPAVVSTTLVILRQSTPAPVAIQLTYPAGTGAFTTSQAAASIRGNASQSSGIQRVAWSTDQGTSGLATGTTAWDTGAIALQPGTNNITVTIVSNDGGVGTVTVHITYARLSVNDTTAPTLTLISPGSATLVTIADSITVRGTASDNIGVTAVSWFASTGKSGSASGTTSWTTPPIALIHGDNSVVVRAFDAAGNMAWRVVNVTRQ